MLDEGPCEGTWTRSYFDDHRGFRCLWPCISSEHQGNPIKEGSIEDEILTELFLSLQAINVQDLPDSWDHLPHTAHPMIVYCKDV